MGIIQSPSIDAFLQVAQTGSVHSAATELGLTQTAVTKRIQALEEELKLTLFLRSRRGMELTEDGTAFLKHCRSVVELEGLFLSRIAGETRSEVNLVIVGPTSAIATRVAKSCAAIYKKYDHLRLHLKSDDHSNRIDLLRRGEADFAIVPPERIPNEMESKILKPDRYLLVASAEWKGRKLSDILSNERIIDFYEQDSTTRNYLKRFDLYVETLRSRLFVNDNAALIELIQNGVGFGTLTEEVARPALEAGRLITLNRGQPFEDPLALVWYPRTQRPDYFSAIIRELK